jgi:hypothetical protein
MKIQRLLLKSILDNVLQQSKILIVYGARQVGKTTLINDVLDECPYRFLRINADERKYVDVLSSEDFYTINQLISGYDGVFIDEAQRISNIGINLKIIHDKRPNFKIIASGSSSFELANKIKEPLTGRAWTYTLYPIAQSELSQHYNPFEMRERLESSLRFGHYPEVFSYESIDGKIKYLRELASSYLYKDIVEISSIRHSNKLHDLLKLLAFQIGNLVSFTELAEQLSMSKDTVEHYVDLLEKAFILIRLPGFSRNMRKEITKMPKIYFNDLGIRNMIIDNFKALSDRNDVGQLWENFLVIERIKSQAYQENYIQPYFWRTYSKAELDYVEEQQGELHGYEFKWRLKNVNVPKSWNDNYPNAGFTCIHQDNYLNFIT